MNGRTDGQTLFYRTLPAKARGPISLYFLAICANFPSGPKFGKKKNSLAKRFEHSVENSLPQATNFLGFVKCFSEFAKGIYETCDRNLFKLAIIIIVAILSIVHFILFLCFASHN